MAFLNLDSLTHPGVLITDYDLGLKLGERVTAACNPKHLYWENLSAGCSGPCPAPDLYSTAFVNEGFF